MSDISVIGLGMMGSALARTLLAKGYAVTVWNRSPDKATALVAAGAHLAATAADAIAASPATLTCLTSHDRTIALLRDLAPALPGKTILELSTGGATDAQALAALLTDHGASWMIGILNAYPETIGKPDTVISVVGDPALWHQWRPVFQTLGGASAHVGQEAGMAAALFAALFTTRQGFMFGMIYGALICQKAGIPLQAFSDQIPVSLGMLPDYHAYFAATVPNATYDNPSATMASYAAALEDALATFRTLNAPADLPQLLSDLTRRGMDAGLGDQALTALVAHLAKN